MPAQYLLLAPFFLRAALAGTLYTSSFPSSLAPFSTCNLKSPSSITANDGSAVFYFVESDFNNTRDDKGVEICVFEPETSTNVPQMTKEGWQGFSIYFCPGGCSSWCGGLHIVENALVAEHRAACGEATTTTLVADIERDTWHDVVVHMRVSQEDNGVYQVWWDGTQVYSADGINVGFGTWDGDILSSGWYFKNGIYAFDTEDYIDGATRTLLFDDVSWYETDSGETDGHDTVAPGSGS